MKWPRGFESCFCLRIDVDTVRDAKVIPTLLKSLDELGVKATLFITTGPDDSGRGILQGLPRALKGKYLARYGWDGLRTLIQPYKSVEGSIAGLKEDLKHEIALHGYAHRRWIKSADSWSVEEADRHVREGLERFMKAFGFKPYGFAAPGFVVNDNVLNALNKIRFIYTSNYRLEGGRPFRHGKFHLIELPVTCFSLEELLYRGLSKKNALKKILKKARSAIGAGGYFCYYTHPSFEAYVEPRGMRRILSYVMGKADVWKPTMRELAEWLRKVEL